MVMEWPDLPLFISSRQKDDPISVEVWKCGSMGVKLITTTLPHFHTFLKTITANQMA